MHANNLTFTKKQAQEYLYRNRRSDQIYMYKFDVDVVFRKGKLDDDQISKVRYKEDSRPSQTYNSRTKSLQDKKNDVITYRTNRNEDLYVLAKSGGVSLFDGMSNKIKLGKKDYWWVITKNARLEKDLVIAKDMFKDSEGNTHYSVEPDRDMLLSEYIEKLDCLRKYMRQKV
ncbi:hypothetical protein [Sessilibacter corallicola]|uniref:Tse2 ADP-ribosyltransferase toxin domain-containing protein n=1 Tax=Sessilibacter corallicola TaxID=2904075 RepID=A0ABQ0A3Y2_9GAMM